jgi:hypothetical protein
MKVSEFSRYGLGICVAVAMLAGCGGSQPPIGALGAMPQSRAGATHDAHSGSWMLAEALSEDLLYISNVYTVTVYSYPRGRHVGTLKGFYRPLGECSDKAGDVFIANGDTILEYKHGGTKSIQTLTFAGYGAESCAADPATGNLAVTWDQGLSQGYVAIYQHASGTPKLYRNSNMLFVWCGYDNAGNLYVDGQYGSGNNFAFAELPKGGTSLENIMLNQSFQNAGAVQWDGKYVAVGDDVAQKIYQFTIKGSSGTLEGTTNLGNADYVYQWVIHGKKVVGSDDIPSRLWYWNYPAGGAAIKSITKDVFHPIGATISLAPH